MDRCKLCGKELDPMEGRLMIPDFHYRSRHLRLKYNHDSGINTQYMISGRFKVVMDDGTEEEFGPGDAAVIPPGHNAWVIGNEPVVAVDFTGLKDYARKS